jgi:uncharacterized protein (TIGR03663 family)
MILNNKKPLLLSLIIVVAMVFRLPELSERPMHGDEAVNAVKFSQLLESGKFVYDPTDYHGPSLCYFTLPACWISGQSSLKELSETTLRMVPIIFGVGLVLLLFMLKVGVEWYILCLAAFLSAISPAFVFYSRYYIHEMLLVFFCYFLIFSGYRYCKSQTFLWNIFTGLSLGLLISTKETWVILVFMILISLILTFLPFKKRRTILLKFLKSIPRKHIVVFLIVTLLTIILLYSSFFQHPQADFQLIHHIFNEPAIMIYIFIPGICILTGCYILAEMTVHSGAKELSLYLLFVVLLVS